ARSESARLLVEGMVAEHRVILGLADEVAQAAEPVQAAAAAYALQVLFQAHLSKENDLVLPVVVADEETSLAEVLHGMHELLGHEGGGA
ncbi:MAG TPA: hemerythrin domain-containing protein, partial [Jiangellales bacterium]|nr:hemerythrin domain-containing protein [Jiangellales bacterium]